MNCVKVIIDASEKIKNSFTDHSIKIGQKDLDFDNKYKTFSAESGLIFSDDIQNMYREISRTKITWSLEKSRENLYGGFEMIPIEDIVPMHDNMVEMLESVYDYASGDKEIECAKKLKVIENMYPIFDFCSGEAFCVHNKTGQILLFDHDAFELIDGNVNGLIIAENYSDLIEKWSNILFLEQFWYFEEYKRCVDEHGIDLGNEFLTNFRKGLI